MKINDQNLTGVAAPETGRAQEFQKLSRARTDRSPAPSGVEGTNDRVEFSGTLGRLSRVLTTFESTRANRAQALAVQYQSGKFKPNSAATSRGLIDAAISDGSR